MQIQSLTYLLLSLALVAGGGALIVHASQTVRRLVAARVDMIARPARAAGTGATGSHGLVKVATPAGAGADGAMAVIARLCRRLKLDPAQAPAVLMAARLTAGAILGLAGFVFARHVMPSRSLLALAPILAFGGLAAAGGWALPSILAAYLARQRTAEIVSGFPEALELMVVCVEAGLGLEESIERASFELKLSQPTLAAELAQTSADLQILPDRDQALRNLAERTGASSVRSVTTALSQTLRYGTPLAQALRVAASELRNDSLLTLEERANRLPTLLTLPMMLFIMPTILLVIGGPAMIQVLDSLAK